MTLPNTHSMLRSPASTVPRRALPPAAPAAGKAPLHLTPNWVHPKSTFEDFFGGILIVTAEQFQRINGFGTNFWGWGREDDNLRERLVAAGKPCCCAVMLRACTHFKGLVGRSLRGAS